MPDRFNDWYDYVNPVRYAQAGYDYFYGDPAEAQKTAYSQAGNAASALGREQRDWYTQQGNTALGFFGSSAPTMTQPMTGGRAFGGGAAAGFPTGGGTGGPTRARDAFGAGGGGGSGGFFGGLMGARAGNAPTQGFASGAPTADDALGQLAANRPTQQADFYDKMQGEGARPQQQQTYFDYMSGQAGGKTNLENLYASRLSGGDPTAAFEDERAVRALNNRAAAGGGFNSGAGIRAVGDYYANAGAQRARALADLAGGADASRLGLSNAYGGAAAGASGEQRGYFSDVGDAARGASGEQRDYFSDLFGGALGLGKAKADTFTHFADKGGQAYSEGQLAQIEAQLAAAGVDAATRKQLLSDLGAVAKFGTSVAMS